MSYRREIILNYFQELIFEKTGNHLDDLKSLRADASEKMMYRLFSGDRTYIGVFNDAVDENKAFINFTKSFLETELNVPYILNHSKDHKAYIEQDLGDESLFTLISKGTVEDPSVYYHKALSDLAKFQIEAGDKIDYNYCYQTKEFTSDVIRDDLEKFNNYFLKLYRKKPLTSLQSENILNETNALLNNINSTYFLYRDFQPRNILVKDGDLYYIDYQSGRRGPLHYDVASFLYSGSINLDEVQRLKLLEHYITSVNKYFLVDGDLFRRQFYFFAFLRLIQVLGSYAFQFGYKKDENLLKKIPKAIKKLEEIRDKLEDSSAVLVIDLLNEI